MFRYSWLVGGLGGRQLTPMERIRAEDGENAAQQEHDLSGGETELSPGNIPARAQ
jgi:hypothetical protein